MDLEKLPIAILVISLFSFGFISYAGTFASLDSTLVMDNSFNGTFNKMNEQIDAINESTSGLFEGGVNSNFGFVPTIQAFFGMVKIMFNSVGFLDEIVNAMAISLNIPAYIVTIISGILFVVFLFAVYRATLGRTKV